MRASLRFASALLLVASVAAGAGPSYKAPVAVLPFKNLNDDLSTNWLKLGVAETMISDLKKAKVTVVERDQIDKALGEILLQNSSGTEDAQAVQVGKLVGAKTVVAGSFQVAGKQLRFNARFVEVETGVILDSAKATGPLEKVFALQDEVVDKLLGTDAKVAAAARPKRQATAKTVEAYKLYATSLGTSSDAERVGLLKKSLSLDPSFVYAKDELAALESRMAEYARNRDRWIQGEDAEIWKLLADPAVDAQTKSLKAGMMIGRKHGSRKPMEMLADSRRIVSMNIPDPPKGVVSATETALFTIFITHVNLRQKDLALQAGEEVMKRYPDGVWFSSVKTQMQIIVDEKKKMEAEGRPEIEKRFAEIDQEIAALDTKFKHWTSEQREDRRIGMELERCWYPYRRDPERAVTECRAFLAKWGKVLEKKADPVSRMHLRHARDTEIDALIETGRWEEALPLARAFVAEDRTDDFGKSMATDLERNWPLDIAPER